MHNPRRNRRRISTKSYRRRLTSAEALVSCPVLNQIKPYLPVHVWDSANSFKFHSCGHTLQETRRLCFRLGPAAPPSRSTGNYRASQQSLWLGLQRSLIVFDTPTLVLGRRASPRRALSPLVVLVESAYSTSRQPILPPSNFSLPFRRKGGSARTLRHLRRPKPPQAMSNLGHSD